MGIDRLVAGIVRGVMGEETSALPLLALAD